MVDGPQRGLAMATPPKPRPKSPPRPAPGPSPTNSVRLDAAKLNRFLDERDAMAAKVDSKPRRDFVRWAFRSESIPLTVVHPGGSSSVFNVACRNLSSGGMGVLHSSFMHNGTPCSVCLRDTAGKGVTIEGKIVRCVHASGTIHELGIKFGKSIDTKQFIALDPFANGFSLETVDPQNLRGTVLYVSDSPLDQSLVRHFLRETQLQLIVCATHDEGLAKAMEGMDLILCEYTLGESKGSDFVLKARRAGLSQPILIVTADTSAATRAELINAQATAVVTKPLLQETLFRALAEFMVLSSDSGGIASTLDDNHANVGLLETFVDQIKQQAGQLESAIEEGNQSRARSLCLQIVGTAPVMGYQKLADLARTAELSLSKAPSISEASVPLRTLIGACQRTSARRAAA